jgi:hypothetical protein
VESPKGWDDERSFITVCAPVVNYKKVNSKQELEYYIHLSNELIVCKSLHVLYIQIIRSCWAWDFYGGRIRKNSNQLAHVLPILLQFPVLIICIITVTSY